MHSSMYRPIVALALCLGTVLAMCACEQPVPSATEPPIPSATPVSQSTLAPTLAPTVTTAPTLTTAPAEPTAPPTPSAYPEPTTSDDGGEPADGWEGVIVKLAPGSQFGQYLLRGDDERYGLSGADETASAALDQARWTGARIRIWGQVYYGVPATEARHIEVSRVEFLSGPATEARNLSYFAQADASSALPADRWGSYGPLSAIDGTIETAWAEGADGAGSGEWLRLVFPAEIVVDHVNIDAGYDADEALFAANNRIRRATLEFSGGERVAVALSDARGLQKFAVGGISTTWVRLVVEEVYPGASANDTCVAELEVWGRTE
jgi:hypothetical protein